MSNQIKWWKTQLVVRLLYVSLLPVILSLYLTFNRHCFELPLLPLFHTPLSCFNLQLTSGILYLVFLLSCSTSLSSFILPPPFFFFFLSIYLMLAFILFSLHLLWCSSFPCFLALSPASFLPHASREHSSRISSRTSSVRLC